MNDILLISIIGYLLIGYFATYFHVVAYRQQLMWPLAILMIPFYLRGGRGRRRIKLQWPITFR